MLLIQTSSMRDVISMLKQSLVNSNSFDDEVAISTVVVTAL